MTVEEKLNQIIVLAEAWQNVDVSKYAPIVALVREIKRDLKAAADERRDQALHEKIGLSWTERT